MFVMRGTIILFSWILFNHVTGLKGECVGEWNVIVSNNLETRWTGEETEGAEVEVTVTATYASEDDCPGRKGRTEFKDLEFPPLKNPCSNTAYNVTVDLICNGNVNGSRMFVIWTPPNAPSNVKFKDVTSSSFEVSWDPPAGNIAAYKVDVNGTVYDAGDKTSLLVTELYPRTWYNLMVSAEGQGAWSDWSDVVFVQTKPEDIPVLVLEMRNVSNTSVEVYWQHPGGKVQLFSVRWTGEGNKTPQYKNVTTEYCEIGDLIPYTFYDIEVAAWVEDKMGTWSNVLQVQTKDGIPFPPRNLREGTKTNTSVEVLWEEPKPYRGPILHYNVWYLAGKAKRSLKIMQTHETRFLVENLLPARKYTIKVRAVTSAGYSDWTNLDVRTLPGTPHPPTNVSAESETSNSIKITWDIPKPFVGQILTYTVLWKELGSNEPYLDNTTETSYVIDSLKPYSNFSIQVKAWTRAGPGNWSGPITARVSPGVPYLPKELKATNITDVTIRVEWEEPQPFVGPIIQYTVKWIEVKSKTEETEYSEKPVFVIQKLQPFTNYTIAVQAQTVAGTGNWSEPITVTTGIGVPSSPRNLKAKNIEAESILMEWQEPDPYVGPIVRYTVKWMNIKNKLSGNNTTENLDFLIQDLDPFTNYEISVRAETDAGPGMWSDIKKVQTAIGVPSSPRDVKASNITDTTIYMEWLDPIPYVGPTDRYHVEWKNVNNNHTERNDTEISNYLIQSLDPYTNYKISVQAETKAGRGKWSQPVLLRTDVGVPFVPKNVITTPSNVSIKVQWEEPQPFRGSIEYYTVRWRHSNANSNEGITNSTDYVIQNLMPFTSYFVQIRATTSAGGSPWTKAMEVKTLTGIPAPPRNVKEINVTEASIFIEWQEPIPNVGPIIRYSIRWINMNNNALGEGFSANSPFLIQHLNPFTNYSIKVKAETSVGFGDWSDSVLVRTNIGVPSPPRNVEIKQTLNTSIEVTWNEPQPKVGDILEYLIIWTNTKSQTKEAGKTSNLHYVIENLEPYTNYSITVSAKTEAGMGNPSLPLNIRTKSGVPLKPEELEKVKTTNLSIEIKWKEPKAFKGPILSYTVRWRQNSMAETKQTRYVITELSPYTRYSISVRAKTMAGYGNWSDKLELQTDIGIPTTPKNLTVTEKTAKSITVSWFEPDFPNGPLLDYGLEWGIPSTNFSSAQIKDTLYIVSDLLPYTEYQFRVSARTAAGWSASSSWVITRTDIAVPAKAKILSVKLANSSSIVTEWETEVPYPGPTQYKLCIWKWPSTCDNNLSNVLEKVLEGNRSKEDWQHRSLDVVEHLPPYTPFSVQIILNTEAGEMPSDNSLVIWTSPRAPGPPTKITANCHNKSTEAEVRWEVPKNPNGKIIEYLVEYGTELLGYREASVKVKNECKGQSVTLKGLLPERKYRIYVRAKAKDVTEDGERSALEESCVLPAGVPPPGNNEHVTVEASGPYHLVVRWNDVVFTDSMGSLVEYSVIVGLPSAVGKAESGKSTTEIPTWLNFSSGMSEFYQATPPEWNPFVENEDRKDPLNCRVLLEVSRHKTIQCILGLDSECAENTNNTFCNGPLKPNTKYGVKLRAFTRGGFSETAPIFASTAPIAGSGLVGGLVGAFFVLLLIGSILAGIFVIRKKGGVPYLQKVIAPHFPYFKGSPTETAPPVSVVELDSYTEGRCINIYNFSEHVRLMMSDSHLMFSEEFETLKLNSPKYNCASAEMDENRLKNRWMNIYPYDHSRVKLLPLGDELASDFINANYIPGDSSLREYIASQGPLPHTVDDFWRMVWEQSSTMIVMLTQCVERGKVKCEQYWPPPGEARHYGDIQVRSISESMLSSYTIRVFHVQLGSYDRKVKQMHFTRWPDFGCPESPEDLINFVRAVRDHLSQIRPGPIIVHCSAGVGRTGTFIAVDRLMQQLKHSNSIDIYSTVIELRHHRINMVQTEDQYIYIHLCVQQLVREITNPPEQESEEVIYSNLGMDKETGL